MGFFTSAIGGRSAFAAGIAALALAGSMLAVPAYAEEASPAAPPPSSTVTVDGAPEEPATPPTEVDEPAAPAPSGARITTQGYDGSGAVSGTVTSGGTPLLGAHVVALKLSSSETWQYSAQAWTSEQGTYSLPLSEGIYQIRFAKDLYISEFYDNVQTEEYYDPRNTQIELTSAQSGFSNANADLERIPTTVFSGTLTSDGQGIAGGYVKFYQWFAEFNVWQPMKIATTTNNGGYEMEVPRGQYRLEFDGGASYLTEFYNDVQTQDVNNAAVQTVQADTASVVINADVQPRPRYAVSGTVTQAGTGQALEGADVTVYQWTGIWEPLGSPVTTDASGHYSVDLLPGAYRLRFSNGELFQQQVYNGVNTGDINTPAGSDVFVGNTAVTGINAALAKKHTTIVSGSVRDSVSGQVIPNARYAIFEWIASTSSWDYVTDSAIGNTGDYSVELVDGTYRVHFQAGSSYQQQVYNGIPTESSVVDVPGAQSLVLQEGVDTVSGIDAELVRVGYGTLSGTVKNTSGTGLAGAQVMIIGQGPISDVYVLRESDTSGFFSASVPAGEYKVVYSFTSDYEVEGYNDKTIADTTQTAGLDLVTVNIDATTSGIDANLAKLPQLSISGTVLREGPSDGGISTPIVSFWRQTTQGGETVWQYEDYTYAASSGQYSKDLRQGVYRVYFNGGYRYQQEVYNNVVVTEDRVDVAGAQNVDLTSAPATGINASLAVLPTRTVSGTITLPGGALSDSASVAFFAKNGDGWNLASSADRNSFTGAFSTSLPEGTYRAIFYGGDKYLPQLYAGIDLVGDNDGVYTPGAQEIVVGGSSVSGVNATLTRAPYSTVSGTVSSDDEPLAGTRVTVYKGVAIGDGTRWDQSQIKYADDSGRYSFDLTPGDYRVVFAGNQLTYPEVFDGVRGTDPGTEGAQTLTITDDSPDLTDVNASLERRPTHTVSGTVANRSTPLEGVQVTLYSYYEPYDTWIYDSTTETAADGTYSATLPVGEYRVLFDNGSLFEKEFWDGFVTLMGDPNASGPTNVDLSEQDRDNINADLAPLPTGFVTGTVTSKGKRADTATLAILQYNPDIEGWYYVRDAVTDAKGNFRIEAPAGRTTTILAADNENSIVYGGLSDPPQFPTSANSFSIASAATFAAGTLELTGGTYPIQSSAPTVSGKAVVGQKLTATPGEWAVGATLKYQWYAGSAKIAGATSKTYTVSSGQVGKSVSVKVTGSTKGAASATRSSKSLKIAALKFSTTSVPKISGTAKVGKTLKVKVGTWKPSGVKFSYQWYAGSSKVKGATKSSLKIKSSLRGKKLSVRVTGAKAGYTSVTKASKATAAVRK